MKMQASFLREKLRSGSGIHAKIKANIANQKVAGAIQRFWIVTDPVPTSEMIDILYATDMRGLVRLVLGTGERNWLESNTLIYDNEREARKDAEARLV